MWVVLVVLVISVTFLVAMRMNSTRVIRRKELNTAHTRVDRAITALNVVEKEIDLQLAADRPDLDFLRELLREHRVHVLARN